MFYQNEKAVEYTLSRSMSPTMIANYTLKLIDKKIMQKKLEEISEMLEKIQ